MSTHTRRLESPTHEYNLSLFKFRLTQAQAQAQAQFRGYSRVYAIDRGRNSGFMVYGLGFRV